MKYSYKVGDFIGGRYKVLRVMRDGLGIVYAVEHKEGDRLILKAPKGASDELVQRSFRVEAETWVRMGNHPNIVQALMVDEISGQLFVAAELVEPDESGRTSLRDYLRGTPLAPNAVATWSADFCYGMIYAATKGLIAHRDIKPENLLIGATGILRVTDFGIARAVQSHSEAREKNLSHLGNWQTISGQISGTPAYMAPEQWRAGTQDIRSDIYAFGVVLYEMICGTIPFTGPGIEDLAHQHLAVSPRIPHGIFSPMIARCLSKDPAARYQTPQHLLVVHA
jgi:serine/threonine-protein kinase